MTISQVRVSRELKASARAFQQLADQTIKKDPVRALVEVITNSDDSYKKLERFGIEHDGEIIIKFKRAQGWGQFIIIDHAEGMDSEKMDDCVGMYGAETHGFEAGEGGRSFFGRGLKEAILSMGQGFVKSIHNNFYHQSLLNINKYEREVPREAPDFIKEELGIRSHGTKVILNANRAGIKIPQFEKLKRHLELHYALRDILSTSKRNVSLIELGKDNEIKNQVRLTYVPPKGEPIINENLKLQEFEGAEVVLEVYKSEEELTGRIEGYLRQNGILICSKGAIHDITLFTFEGEELASNLFGRLTCDYIDNLLRADEQIIRDSRDGMDWSHPLNHLLRKFAEDKLGKYIAEQKEKNKKEEKVIENEQVKRKFRKAIEKLNSIAKAELKDVSTGGVGQEEGSMLPPNGFDFVPNYYHVLVGQKTTLTLKMSKDRYKRERSQIKISSDSPNVNILTEQIDLNSDEINNSVIIAHVYIEGKQIGEESRIIAIAGDLKTEARIYVVAQKEKTKRRRKQQHRGMFKEISYSNTADPNQRVRFDKSTGVITIATTAPSVKLYLGPNGEGQDNFEAQVMTAELVTQAVCREIALRRIQSGLETPLGEPEEFLNSIYNKLVGNYAHIIHSILGPSIGSPK